MHEACWDSQSGTLKVKRNILNIMANDNRLSLEYNFQMTRVNPWLYMHCRERSSYQEERVVIQLSRGEGCDPVIKRGGLGSSYQEGRVGIPLTGIILPHFCACPKPGPGFPTLYVVQLVQLRWEMIVRFVDIGGIDYHHCLKFLFIENNMSNLVRYKIYICWTK